MRGRSVCVMFVLAAVGLPAMAMAQIEGDPTDEPEEPPPSEWPQPSDPVPEAPPPPPPPPPAAPVMVRPAGTSIGLGFGWVMPADLTVPNTASARFRLASGLTLEPLVVVRATIDTQEPPFGDETTDKQTAFAAGANVRLPMASRGRADLALVFGGVAAFVSTNPDGDDNGSTLFNLGLGWGVGIDVWIKPWLSLSTTAQNPFLQYQATSQEFGNDEATTSTVTVGAIWDPQIDVMLHLYF
jgi:hypothetical protein